MTVSLETTGDARVAVLHGVDTDTALQHLGQSLLAGTAFDDRRALVIDLGGCRPSDATAELLRRACQTRLRTHQVVTAATDARDVPAAVARARRWIDRFDRPGTGVAIAVAREVSSVRSLVGTGISIAAAAVSRVVRRPAP